MSQFSKQKNDIQYTIDRLTKECEDYHDIISDINREQIYLQRQIVN
jgi:hypothetical protein